MSLYKVVSDFYSAWRTGIQLETENVTGQRLAQYNSTL